MTNREWIIFVAGSGQAFVVAGVFTMIYGCLSVGLGLCSVGATLIAWSLFYGLA